MAPRLWFLVEWVDERNVFSNYSIVNNNYLLGNEADLRAGSIVLFCDRTSSYPKRGQILRISDNKRSIMEFKVMLERQDDQVKNVLTLCMNSIKEMKTGTLFQCGNHASQISTPQNQSVFNGGGIKMDNSDTDSGEERHPELNVTQSSLKINIQPTRPDSFINNQLLRALHDKSLQTHLRSMASSTPLPPRQYEDDKLTFDQGTQTDASLLQPPPEKVAELDAEVKRLYNKFISLVNQVEAQQSDSTDGNSENEQNIDEVKDDSVVENHNSSCGKIECRKILKVRRASAQTTNTVLPTSDNGADMVSIGSGNAVVPARLLNKIDWSSYTSATRVLLQAVFPRRVLATHSLTGKQSPAFADKPAKQSLDTKLVEDIVNTVSEKCGVSKRLVRSCITLKCTDEAKLYRNRQKHKCSKHQNQENVSPLPASSTDCLQPNQE